MRKQRKQREKPNDPDIGHFPREKALLTPRQTAGVLNITTRTLTNWSRGPRPLLESVKLGKARRYVQADVERLIEKFKIAA
jgi:DNA-binding transcriptional regulator YiaG